MQRPEKSTATVETTDVTRALARSSPRKGMLSSTEEKALRMRHGASVERAAPLPMQGEGNPELKSELRLIELELYRAYKQHMAAQAEAKRAAQPAVVPTSSRAKEKIVRALRKVK